MFPDISRYFAKILEKIILSQNDIDTDINISDISDDILAIYPDILEEMNIPLISISVPPIF